MTAWIEVIVPTTVAATDEVAAEIVAEIADAATGVELRGDEVVFWARSDAAPRVLDDVRGLMRSLAGRGLPVDESQVFTQPALAENEWRDAWKKYFHATRLTRQLVVVPSWESYTREADDRVIDLDPGQAFGTGAHASTQLVLEAMQSLADDGVDVTRFADVGTGSGILSIAACLLWRGARGVATDIDPASVAATRDNLERNGVGARVEVSDLPASALGGPFDLVLANIQAHVLLALKSDLADLVGAGGLLILSGLLTPQADGVANAFETLGVGRVEIVASRLDASWSRVVARRS